MKRRHGAVIYVPERERELVARLMSLSKGVPQPRAVAALYREIMSSSRAAQGQAPIGVLLASAPVVIPASHASFGACDQFATAKSWPELANGVLTGALSLALMTGDDLAMALATDRWRREFASQLTVVGDFTPAYETGVPLAHRVFIVTLRGEGPLGEGDRILILIECKSTLNAIKSLLHSMPENPIHAVHAEEWTPPRQPKARRLREASGSGDDVAAAEAPVADGTQAAPPAFCARRDRRRGCLFPFSASIQEQRTMPDNPPSTPPPANPGPRPTLPGGTTGRLRAPTTQLPRDSQARGGKDCRHAFVGGETAAGRDAGLAARAPACVRARPGPG